MILLDSTALADEVEALLRGGDAGIVSANLTEVIDVLVRVLGNHLETVEAKLVPLLATTLSVIGIGEAEARRAAEIRISHYHRRDAPLSLGDCPFVGHGARAWRRGGHQRRSRFAFRTFRGLGGDRLERLCRKEALSNIQAAGAARQFE
ncbi:MAG TPA: hypothetical protein VFF07_04685 [Actinomycetota bacterium]|nr:hypothetical protein [Actinomycetota bacterium]